MYDHIVGKRLYASYPYLLVMDENSTKMFILEGSHWFKTLKLIRTFYEPQMKVGEPIYFSPNFVHRLYIDHQSKKIMVNHTLTNKNILSIDIKK